MSVGGLVGALESRVMIIEPDVFEMADVVENTSIVAIDGLKGGGFRALRGRHTGSGRSRIRVVCTDHIRIAV